VTDLDRDIGGRPQRVVDEAMLDGLPEAGLELGWDRRRDHPDLDGGQPLGPEIDRPVCLSRDRARQSMPGEERVAVVGDATDERDNEQLGR
jgi:hypothetical protein